MPTAKEELMAEVPENLPSGASRIAQVYPDIWNACAALGQACSEAGAIEGHTLRLVKLALAIGALPEGAIHPHTRRALAEGASKDELKQVAMLAIPTLGFRQGVKALAWIGDITDLSPAEKETRKSSSVVGSTSQGLPPMVGVTGSFF
jgi:alkylhydroperoxidase/carboxymuconolactone decarboxylase family protein YurZ